MTTAPPPDVRGGGGGGGGGGSGNSSSSNSGGGGPNGHIHISVPPSTTPAPRPNALHSRITALLSTSYADLDLRDTLSLLPPVPPNPRTWRLDTQSDLLQANTEIISDFGRVAAQLSHVGVALQNLSRTTAALRQHVHAASSTTAAILADADEILSAQHTVANQSRLLAAVTQHFLLTDAETAHLTSPTSPLDDTFFHLLSRAQRLHHETHHLLSAHPSSPRLGQDVLAQTSRTLDAAYQRLSRVLLRNPVAERQRGWGVLRRHRPQLWRTCVEAWAERRAEVLEGEFYAALTGTGGGEAIEVHAHDPLRYVGDMLAWVHGVGVSERESVDGLFGKQNEHGGGADDSDDHDHIQPPTTSTATVSTSNDDQEEEKEEEVSTLLNPPHILARVLAGVFRLLRPRFENTLHAHSDDAALAYQLAHLAAFYTSIFSRLLCLSPREPSPFAPLEEAAMRSLRSTLRDRAVGLHVEVSAAIAAANSGKGEAADLGPPGFLTEALAVLEKLMRSYSLSTSPQEGDRVQGFAPVLHDALDPFLSACEDAVVPRLAAPFAQGIFALNCLDAVVSVLSPHIAGGRGDGFIPAERLESLRTQMERWDEMLVEGVYERYVLDSGLQAFLHGDKETELLSEKFDAWLPTAAEEARGVLLRGLRDLRAKTRVVERAGERFGDKVESLEADGLGLRRADEVRVLLL